MSNPSKKFEFTVVERGRDKNGKMHVDLLLPDRKIEDAIMSTTGRYWVPCKKDGRYRWVIEADLYKALYTDFIPTRVVAPKRNTTIKTKKSSDVLEVPKTVRPFSCINYLCKNIKAPKIDARNPIDTDPFHTYDISMLLISCKSIGSFMEEVQAFMPSYIKSPDAFDWSYLDDPDYEDSANDIKLRTWYVRLRAMCKVILSKLNLCYGGLQKNGYQFFLTNCFSKEFGKDITKKSNTTVTVNNDKDKESASKDMDSNTILPQVEISFTEEVNNG